MTSLHSRGAHKESQDLLLPLHVIPGYQVIDFSSLAVELKYLQRKLQILDAYKQLLLNIAWRWIYTTDTWNTNSHKQVFHLNLTEVGSCAEYDWYGCVLDSDEHNRRCGSDSLFFTGALKRSVGKEI